MSDFIRVYWSVGHTLFAAISRQDPSCIDKSGRHIAPTAANFKLL